MGKIKSFSDFVNLYIDGFRNMTWGKPLWIIIFIKLFIMFAVLKAFLFPNFLKTNFETDKERSEYVLEKLVEPIIEKTNESD